MALVSCGGGKADSSKAAASALQRHLDAYLSDLSNSPTSERFQQALAAEKRLHVSCGPGLADAVATTFTCIVTGLVVPIHGEQFFHVTVSTKGHYAFRAFSAAG
jgi:hypothetical protein